MNWQGYPESYWPQQSHSLSQETSRQSVSSEVQDHTELAHNDTQLYSAGLHEEKAGQSASSESWQVHHRGRG